MHLRLILYIQVILYVCLGIFCLVSFSDFEYTLPRDKELGQYLGVDSWRYMSYTFGLPSYSSSIIDLSSSGIFFYSNFFLYFIGWVSHSFFDSGYLFIFLFNSLLFFHIIYLLKSFSNFYKISHCTLIVLFLLNPLVFYTVFSLNKEIIGLWLVLFGIWLILKKKTMVIIILILFSLFVKSFFSVLLLLLWVSNRYKIPPFYILLSLSIFIPIILRTFGIEILGGGIQSLSQSSEFFGQKSSNLMRTSEQLIYIPFGFFIS